VVDNIVVKTFFDEAIKYYHPENCLLSKSHTPKTTGTKRALNQEELFDLFKKILVPLPPIKQSELNELTISSIPILPQTISVKYFSKSLIGTKFMKSLVCMI